MNIVEPECPLSETSNQLPATAIEAKARLRALMIIENSYRTNDYVERIAAASNSEFHTSDCCNDQEGCRKWQPIDDGVANMTMQWRAQICAWCIRVADRFQLERELVYVALSYLDRFLSSNCESILENGQVGTKAFQALAFASFYLALKVNEGKRLRPDLLSPESFITLSGDPTMTPGILAEMELIVLRELSWRINPPTPQRYLSLIIDDIAKPAIAALTAKEAKEELEEAVENVMDLAQYIVELSTVDYDLSVKCSAFTVSFGALICVTNLLAANEQNDPQDTCIYGNLQRELLQHLHDLSPSEVDLDEIRHCNARQLLLYKDQTAEDQIEEIGPYDSKSVYPNTPVVVTDDQAYSSSDASPMA